MGNFDVTLGMGWGRLAGKGDFENPMTWLSDSFDVRDSDTGLGGELSTGDFFSGKEVGLFGGISYDDTRAATHRNDGVQPRSI